MKTNNGKEELKKFQSSLIKGLRKEKRLTQQNVADRLEINRLSYRDLEEGKSNITSYHIYELSNLYNKSVSFFFPNDELKMPLRNPSNKF